MNTDLVIKVLEGVGASTGVVIIAFGLVLLILVEMIVGD